MIYFKHKNTEFCTSFCRFVANDLDICWERNVKAIAAVNFKTHGYKNGGKCLENELSKAWK